jgi:hypothetical protein
LNYENGLKNRATQKNGSGETEMNSATKDNWQQWISPLRITLLMINAFCFGGLIVLLALGGGSGSTVVLTIGVGLMLFAGLTGAIVASRRDRFQIEK